MNRGRDDDALAGRALDGEAAAVDLGLDVLDDHALGEAVRQRRGWPGGGAGGFLVRGARARRAGSLVVSLIRSILDGPSRTSRRGQPVECTGCPSPGGAARTRTGTFYT